MYKQIQRIYTCLFDIAIPQPLLHNNNNNNNNNYYYYYCLVLTSGLTFTFSAEYADNATLLSV